MKLVNSRETYNAWLKRQSHEFQNEALGIERAKLFRAGKFGMKGFIDPVTGRTGPQTGTGTARLTFY